MQVAKDRNQTSTNNQIKVDKFYLQPLDNKQRVQKCMYLHTGTLSTGHNVREVPITDLVIKVVESMVAEQGNKTLKIKEKKKVPLHPVN